MLLPVFSVFSPDCASFINKSPSDFMWPVASAACVVRLPIQSCYPNKKPADNFLIMVH